MQTTNDLIGESSPALISKLAQLEFLAVHFNGDLVQGFKMRSQPRTVLVLNLLGAFARVNLDILGLLCTMVQGNCREVEREG
jgi:hypothetical protein